MTRKDNPLHVIYYNLYAGGMYGTCEPWGFSWALFKDGRFWRWRCYGSSANRATLAELRWILEVVFKMTPDEFLKTYTLLDREGDTF